MQKQAVDTFNSQVHRKEKQQL